MGVKNEDTFAVPELSVMIFESFRYRSDLVVHKPEMSD